MDEDCECHRILREKLGIPEKVINELTGGDSDTETNNRNNQTKDPSNRSTGSTEEWGI